MVVGYYRSPANANSVVKEIDHLGGHAISAAADVTDAEAVHELATIAANWTGRLDSVVNAAGIQPLHELASMSVSNWNKVVHKLLTSAFVITQAAAAVMADRGGSVTHIASIEASQPARMHGHYSTAKAGVFMLARSAALEFGPTGVRVSTVSPGLTDRDGLAEQWPEEVERWTAAAPQNRSPSPMRVRFSSRRWPAWSPVTT